MTELLRRAACEGDDLQALRARGVELEAAVLERDRDLARIKDELDAFRASYRQRVGTLHEQLDELELAIAEAELGELAAQLEGAALQSAAAPGARGQAPRLTSDAIRTLFRDVAKAIHPDLAGDEQARCRRQALMAEANRAYADRDEEQLRLILALWERSPEAVQGSDPAAIRLRLVRRIVQLEERMAALEIELEELKASPLWALKAQVDQASRRGRDLVAELVARLERDIMVATNRLAAMRPPERP